VAERPLTQRKALGSYYTDPLVVDFLVGWGMRLSAGIVMDPACGDGRFLAQAADLGAAGLIGCDLDPQGISRTGEALAGCGVEHSIFHSDFFSLAPADYQPVDLIVGNPPFVRFQHFSGDSRSRALQSALRTGARLSRLTASWAPFLLHALQFLRPGGAMAMVVPAELAQTSYGVTTLQALCGKFARISLLSFCRNWFADAQQETFLLLAEGTGGSCSSAELIPLNTIHDLRDCVLTEETCGIAISPDPNMTLGLAYLSPESRALWQETVNRPEAVSLHQLGDIGNGYVSGANDFFHRARVDAIASGLPEDWLIPTARSIRSLEGLEYRSQDVAENEGAGVAHHLILPRSNELFASDEPSLRRFCAEGERQGISERYKCRSRNPWWHVPGLIVPDVFLPYMIGSMPRSAVNRAHAIYPNSLHGIRLRPGNSAERLAFGLLSTFSLLSMEFEGRSYGGGVLKLEPSEMQRVRVIMSILSEMEFSQVFADADHLLRAHRVSEAIALADRVLLADQLGLNESARDQLAKARKTLLDRRVDRAARGNRGK
jgi:adenine-specific DNA-methyltransferase